MIIVITALISLAVGNSINPAFDATSVDLQSFFTRGYKDAEHVRDDEGVINRYRRGIGDVRKNILGSKETVSYLWAYPPRLIAYDAGFRCRKKYEPDDKIRDIENRLESGVFNPAKELTVFGTIQLLPSRGGLYGALTRRSNPRDLEDVRVVLKVGNHIYQPIKQPGDLLDAEGTGTNTYSNPDQERTSIVGSATNRAGEISFRATETTTYTISHEEHFKWYLGSFRIAFALFDPDGTPRLSTDDRKFEVIVVYGTNERHAEYDLKDFLNL